MPSINDYPLVMIVWNLFLAAIPCYVAYEFQKKLRGKKIKKIPDKKQYLYLAAFIFWMAFLPNTAYLISLVRHLIDHCKNYNEYHVCLKESWMVPFFFSYALLGVPSFWYSLRTMAQTLGKLIHPKITVWLPILMVPLTALAVLFGLVDRLNSWDIAARPMLVLQTAWTYVSNWNQMLNFATYTIALYFIYYGVEKLRKIK